MPIDFASDLNQLDVDVAAARERLAQLEQERADLNMDLREFEMLYQVRVGPIQAQLEAAQLHIAEYRLRIDLVRFRGRSLAPSQLEAEVEWQLRDQRQRTESTENDARTARSRWAATPDRPDPAANLNLKQVYRELAKHLHPDLVQDMTVRAERSQRMAQVNTLYAQHELSALQQLLRVVVSEQERLTESAADRYARLKYEQTQLAESIHRVKAEIAELERGTMMQLKIEYALQRARGRDVLNEVIERINAQLQTAQTELTEWIAKFRELIETTGWTE